MEKGKKTLYHELQESKLCALHCLNSVLQGPLFSEQDLAAMASDLDRAEKQVMLGSPSGDFHPEISHNVSGDGEFSIQVITKALEVWNLVIIPLNSQEARATPTDPGSENAYVCHLHDHWFCLRKVDDEWYNFDSLYAAPEHLSKFYLSAYIDSLKTSGWSVFLVRGDLPECPIKSSNKYGKWMSPADAKRILISFAKKQEKQEMANKRRRRCSSSAVHVGSSRDDEEEDKALMEAIAASLNEENHKQAQHLVENNEESDMKRVKEERNVNTKDERNCLD